MTSVSRLSSNGTRTQPDLFVVKIYGKHRRAERAAGILRKLDVDHRSTVCVCQDDLMRGALQAFSIECLSFYDVLDREAELAAWRQATRVRSELLSLLSRSPFSVKGYQCTEGLVGVDADEFASLASLLLLRERLVRDGFRRVVFLPSESSLSHIPDGSQSIYLVVADGRVWETSRALLKKAFTYFLPFLAILRRQTIFQECLVYSIGHASQNCLSGMSIRVLIVATDIQDFPSYYSRPAASIGAACVKGGHQTLIVTNVVGSPVEYLKHGFRKMRYRKLVLPEIRAAWKEVLRLRRHVSDHVQRTPEGTPGDLWSLTCALVVENLSARASAMAAAIALFDDIYTHFLPSVLVVIPDRSYYGMAAVAVGRRNMVPSLTALAGQIFDHPQYGFLNADVVAVNSDSAKEVYLERGIASTRVFVTGMAHYDDTFRLAESLLESRKQAESKVIVFATENLPLAETFRMISSVASAALAIPQARIVIRPHPRENPKDYEDFVDGFASGRITVDSTTPLLELLSISDVCVTGFSNVAVEAMILERPVICMNLSGESDKLPYAQDGAALGVHQPQEVGPTLMKALFDEETKASLKERRTAFLKREFCIIEGDASLRIVRLIEELASGSMKRKT